MGRCLGLLWLLLLCGCSALGPVASLVLPEQRHLDLRQPGQLPSAPIPPLPPPQTVSDPPPPVDPKNL